MNLMNTETNSPESKKLDWTTFYNSVSKSEKTTEPLVVFETADADLIAHIIGVFNAQLRQYEHNENRAGWIDLIEHAAEQASHEAVQKIRSNSAFYAQTVYARSLVEVANKPESKVLWCCCDNDAELQEQAKHFFSYLPGWKLRFMVNRATRVDAIRASDFGKEFNQCLMRFAGSNLIGSTGDTKQTFVQTVMQAITIASKCDSSKANKLLGILSDKGEYFLPKIEQETKLRTQKDEAQKPKPTAKTQDHSEQKTSIEELSRQEINEKITGLFVWQSNIIKTLIEFFHPDLVQEAKAHGLENDFFFACARVANTNVSSGEPVWFASELLSPRLKSELEDPGFRAWLRRFEGAWPLPSPLTLADDSSDLRRFLLDLQTALRTKFDASNAWSLTEGFRYRTVFHLSLVGKLLEVGLKNEANDAQKPQMPSLKSKVGGPKSRAQIREHCMLIRCLIPVFRFAKTAEPVAVSKSVTELTTLIANLEVKLKDRLDFNPAEHIATLNASLGNVITAQLRLQNLISQHDGKLHVDAAQTDIAAHLQEASLSCEVLLGKLQNELTNWQLELGRGAVMVEASFASTKLSDLVAHSSLNAASCTDLLTKIQIKLKGYPTELMEQITTAGNDLANAISGLKSEFNTIACLLKRIDLAEHADPDFESDGLKNLKSLSFLKLKAAFTSAPVNENEPQRARKSSSLKLLHTAQVLIDMERNQNQFVWQRQQLTELKHYLDTELAELWGQTSGLKAALLSLHTPAIDALEIEIRLLQHQFLLAASEVFPQVQDEALKTQRKDQPSVERIWKMLDSLEATQKIHPAIAPERVQLLRAEWHESQDQFQAAIGLYDELLERSDYLHDPVLWRLAHYGALRCRMSARSRPEYAVLSKLLAFADVQDLRAKQVDQYGPGGELIIFPSFRSSVRQQVAQLCEAFQDDGGLSLFIDHDQNENEDFDPVIYERLLSADAAIIFLSEDYMSSPWCQAELTLLLQQNRFRETKLYYVEVDTRSNNANSINSQSQYFKDDRITRLRMYGEKLVPEMILRNRLVDALKVPMENLIAKLRP
jgi:TIR domain